MRHDARQRCLGSAGLYRYTMGGTGLFRLSILHKDGDGIIMGAESTDSVTELSEAGVHCIAYGV
jgi:hypothetical protein